MGGVELVLQVFALWIIISRFRSLWEEAFGVGFVVQGFVGVVILETITAKKIARDSPYGTGEFWVFRGFCLYFLSSFS